MATASEASAPVRAGPKSIITYLESAISPPPNSSSLTRTVADTLDKCRRTVPSMPSGTSSLMLTPLSCSARSRGMARGIRFSPASGTAMSTSVRHDSAISSILASMAGPDSTKISGFSAASPFSYMGMSSASMEARSSSNSASLFWRTVSVPVAGELARYLVGRESVELIHPLLSSDPSMSYILEWGIPALWLSSAAVGSVSLSRAEYVLTSGELMPSRTSARRVLSEKLTVYGVPHAVYKGRWTFLANYIV